LGVVVGNVIVGNITQCLQVNRLYCLTPAPNPHPPSNDSYLCPSFETDCLGLDFPLGNGVYSFRDFNVISFNNFTANTGDIEGRLATRFNVSLGAGFSIGYELQTAGGVPDNDLPYSLVAGLDVDWISGALYPDGSGIPYPGNEENMFVGGEFIGSEDLSLRVTGGPCLETGCLDSYFNAAQQCYEGYQTILSSYSDNVAQVVQWDGLFLTCFNSTADVYFVTLTSDVMTQYTYTSVDNCNFQAYWVINIAGNDDITINGDSFPAICGGVVYNILGSNRIITIEDTSVCGHILAPYNIIYQPGGVIVGKVVAGDISLSLQINKENTCPNPGTVNLPTSTSTPSNSGTAYLTVAGNGNLHQYDVIFIGEDGTTPYQIISINGNTIELNTPLTDDLPAGTYIYATVSNAGGRPYLTEQSVSSPMPSSSSSSNTIKVFFTFIIILIALAF